MVPTSPPLSGNQRRLEAAAAAGWLLLLAVASILVVLHPLRSIFDVYRDSAHHWWASQPLYGPGMRSFVYLPTSPLIFSPFVLLGRPLDDLAWRVFSVGLFLFGGWRLLRTALGSQARPAAALLLLLLLPCAGVNVQRGQAELVMAGAMFLAAADMATERWWRATLFLCLAVAVKPLALVLALLAAILLPPMRLRLPLGLAATLLLPFLHPDWRYVAAQDWAMLTQMRHTSQPVTWRFDEIGNMLRVFGLALPAAAMTALRAAAALLTLMLAALAQRRLPRRQAALTMLALAVTYLMVCNPRTELGSYLNLGVVVGVFMAQAAAAGRRIEALLLGALILGLGAQVYGSWLFHATQVWLKPLLAMMFYGLLAWRCVRSPAAR